MPVARERIPTATQSKSWSIRLRGCRRRKRHLRVFGDSLSGKERYQNNCENSGHHAEAKDHKFARAATEAPGGKGVQTGFPLTTELAKQQRTWQSPQHRRDQVRSKMNRGQTIEIICQSEWDRAKAKQNYDFPSLLFNRQIYSAEGRMLSEVRRDLFAQEPARQTETAGGPQSNASKRTDKAKRKPKNRRSSNNKGTSREEE